MCGDWLRPRPPICRGPTTRTSPFFSPDGRWIGFFAGGKLKKIAVTGGATVTLCDAPNGRGGAWAEDGTIVFLPNAAGKLDAGVLGRGDARTADVPRRERNDPAVAPGAAGRKGRALYEPAATVGVFDDANLVVQALPAGARKVVQRGGYHGRYLPSGDSPTRAAADRPSGLHPRWDAVCGALRSRIGSAVTGPADARGRRRLVERRHGRGAVRRVGQRHAGVSARAEPRSRVADSLDGTAREDDAAAADAPQPGPISGSRPMAGGSPCRSLRDPRDIWVYEWARDTLTRLTIRPRT